MEIGVEQLTNYQGIVACVSESSGVLVGVIIIILFFYLKLACQSYAIGEKREIEAKLQYGSGATWRAGTTAELGWSSIRYLNILYYLVCF